MAGYRRHKPIGASLLGYKTFKSNVDTRSLPCKARRRRRARTDAPPPQKSYAREQLDKLAGQKVPGNRRTRGRKQKLTSSPSSAISPPREERDVSPDNIVRLTPETPPWKDPLDEWEPPTLPVRKIHSRKMHKRMRHKIGKTNLSPQHLNTMIKGKSWKDIQYEIREHKHRQAKVDHHRKVLHKIREEKEALYNSPNARANRQLRKNLAWGGAMGEIAVVVDASTNEGGDTSHFTYELKKQLRKDKKLKREKMLKQKKIEKAKNFADTLPYLLEPVQFDNVRQKDEALRQNVMLEKNTLRNIRQNLEHNLLRNKGAAKRMKGLFRSIDNRGRGVISRKEFYGVMNEMNPNLRMADIDKIVRNLKSRDGVDGGGIAYQEFTASLLNEKVPGPPKRVRVKWLGERNDFYEAGQGMETGRGGALQDTSRMDSVLTMRNAVSLPALVPPPPINTKSLRFGCTPGNDTTQLLQNKLFSEKERFARHQKLEEKKSRRKVDGYREHFKQLSKSNDMKASLRERKKLVAKLKVKQAYDEPIMERAKIEYEYAMKSGGGGKRLSETYLDHRAHGRGVVQVGGVDDYREAMKRRNPNASVHVRSPEYRRVFNLPQNPKIMAHHRTNSETRQRLFG